MPQKDDELRQAGFSKDGKTAESQIVLGLLVSEDGCPLSYSIFNGRQYESRTMIPIIDDFVQRFNLKDWMLSIAKTITTLRIRLPNGSVYTETLYTTPQQEAIKPLLDALEQASHE